MFVCVYPFLEKKDEVLEKQRDKEGEEIRKEKEITTPLSPVVFNSIITPKII